MAVQVSKDPRLAAYTVVKAIGKGSYGDVFLVRHCREKKQFVMKNIKLTASSAKERLAAEQEASLLSKLQHPNIVSYKESFQDEHGMLHIVMGYCEGGDLCSRLKTYHGQLLPESQVVEWFVQIALALQYLHEKNILHRDLKTQNIFLSKNDIIKVGDLGIARVLDGSCDLAHTMIGTPYYMSPELFANKPYNHKSDIWALGCCVYEMATLKHAFTARNLNALMYKIVQGKVPPLPSQFSAELCDLVGRMMARSARDRPSVHQILRMEFIRRHIKMFLDRATSRKSQNQSSQSIASTKHSNHSRPPKTSGESTSGGGRGGEGRGDNGERRRSSSDGGTRESGDPPLPPPTPAHLLPPDSKRRSNSLSSLVPEDRGRRKSSSGSSPENSRHSKPPRPTKAKKPPRPLPPDPSAVRPHSEASSTGSRTNDTESPVASEVPSARERRRKRKAAGRGCGQSPRVVLRSRSSSDLQRRNSGEKRREETDGPTQERRASQESPGEEVDGEGQVQTQESGPRVGVVECGPAPLASSSCEDSNNEVDEFFTLLDTTLHLPPPSPHPLNGELLPPAKIAFTEPEDDVASAVPSGRLRDRISALRQECVRGLGGPVMERAYLLLDDLDPDNAEEVLLGVLGREKFGCYAAKLQQLKLCEDSLFGL